MAPSASQALAILRDPSMFQWYIIPFLLVVLHIYFADIGRKNWNIIIGGLAFWGMEWHHELWNSVIFHLSGFAPLWGAPGDTAYLILIGLNIEISFMFLIMGSAVVRLLPADKKTRILGLPNRIFLAVMFATLCVLVEMVLNAIGALTWEYWWWSTRFPFLIIFVAYSSLFLVAFRVHDLESRKKQISALLGIYGIDALLVILFGIILKWI